MFGKSKVDRLLYRLFGSENVVCMNVQSGSGGLIAEFGDRYDRLYDKFDKLVDKIYQLEKEVALLKKPKTRVKVKKKR